MKRIIFIVLAGLIVSVSMMANVLTEEQALVIAKSFRQSGARSTINPTLVYTGMATSQKGARSTNIPAFYVYNYGTNDGFVIVSAEDTTLPILAFSDKGQFVADERMPIQVASWLKGYCEYIEQVRSGSRYVEPAPDLGVEINIAVKPLLKTEWDQVEPYNNDCPAYDAVENCATGCAATAIAQIMKHHNWPNTGEGTITHNGVVMDFSQSHYDWNNMLDTYITGAYTKEQGDAVAKLMYDIGMAAEMMYGYESGTQNCYIFRALYSHFKYSKGMQYIVRNCMTTAEWKERIRKELDENRPVYYGGFAEDMSMGHAFVCDGIDETNNYFHFNWGWSGHCNGYYFLNALNPPILGVGGGDGNFNADHVAIVGIQPAVEGEADNLCRSVLFMRKGFSSNTSQTSLGKQFSTKIGNIWNFGPEPTTTQIAIALYQDGEFVNIVSALLEVTMGVSVGLSGISIPVLIPNNTPNGKYELLVVVGDKESGWTEIPYYYDCYQHSIQLEVANGKVTIESTTQSEIQLNANLQQQLSSVTLPGKEYIAQIQFNNIGSWNFDGTVGCRLLQLPATSDNTQYTGENMVTLSEKEVKFFLYSEDSKQMTFDYRLSTPANYMLQAYYIDPLSVSEVIAGEWLLTLEEPSEKFNRQLPVEFDVKHKDATMLQGLSDMWIPIGIDNDAYIDSLTAHSLGDVSVARRHDLSSSSSVNFEKLAAKIASEPAIASINLKARYASADKDSVEFSFGSTFAYSPEALDIRYSLLMVEKTSMGGEALNIGKGFYPTESFNGIAGSIPDTIKLNDEHLYNYICAINTENPNVFFVGLLIDGVSGEIYNATTLNFEDIAPMEGEAAPVSVNLERNSATMNSGLDITLSASVSPSIASQDIVWTSSNPEVAIFKENGKLKTLAAGSIIVRATSAVNSDIYAEMQVTILDTDYTQVQLIEAGYLHYMVNFNACPDTLKLEGELNGTDIALLRYMSGGNNILDDDYSIITLDCPLQSLDISQCRIVEGGNPYRKDFKTQNDVLGEEMFKGCLFLKEIKLPQTITQIGDNAFYECGRGDLKTLEIPASVESIGYAPFYGCTGIDSFTVAAGNTSFKAVDGVLYNYTGTELVAYPTNKNTEDYQAIETLTKILPYAFNHVSHLKSFSSNLRNSSIGRGAFYNASKLESVNLSTRLNFVDEYAFAKCTALKNITCKRVTPAECADNAFEEVPEDCILNLPDNYDEEYHTASGWSYFTHISTSIEELQVTNSINVYAVEGGMVVVGVNYGELISVYNSIGVLVEQTMVSGDKTFVPLSTSGLYVVQISRFNTKIVVR